MSADKAKVRIETAFLAIPDAIARDPDLSPSAKLVFGCVYSLAHTPSGCYGSNAALARRVGLARRQIQRTLAELEKGGFIQRHLEGPERDRPAIEVTWRPKVVRPRRGSDKLSTPASDMTHPPYVKCDAPPASDMTHPPTMRRNGTKDKSKKTSGSDEPERFSSKSGQTPTGSESPSSGPDQEDPEAVAAAWRAFRAQHGVGTKARRPDANPCPPEDSPVPDDPLLQAEVARRQRIAKP
jgi:hypothetical protein